MQILTKQDFPKMQFRSKSPYFGTFKKVNDSIVNKLNQNNVTNSTIQYTYQENLVNSNVMAKILFFLDSSIFVRLDDHRVIEMSFM